MNGTQNKEKTQIKERFSWGRFNWWQVIVIRRISNIIVVLALIALALSILFFNHINPNYISVLMLIVSGAASLSGSSMSHWHVRLRDYI